MFNVTTVRGILINLSISLACWALISLLLPVFAAIGAFASFGGNVALLILLLRDRLLARKVLRLPRLAS